MVLVASEASLDAAAAERRVVIGMVTSKAVLGRVAPKWHNRIFQSPWANAASRLCVEYYKKHSAAPGRAITSLYEEWAATQRSPAVAKAVEDFLAELSGEYEHLTQDLNPDHVVDEAGVLFRRVAQQRLREELAAAVDARDADRADQLIAAYRKVEVGGSAGVDLFCDRDEVNALFAEDDAEVLVRYRGPLGELIDRDLARDSFVVFQGTAKSGKSFWLQDVAWRAMCDRRRVAYFEAGDLSKKQVELRFMVRVAAHPWRSTHARPPYWPCEVNYPRAMEVAEDPKTGRRRATITDTEVRTFKKSLDQDRAWRACERVMQTQVKSRRSFFKLSVHANSTLSVDGIRSALDGYAADGWHADIVIVDYSDIMARPVGSADERDAINTTWKQLRRLSQEAHCLVLTATQADADGYSQETLTRKNFSGDRRKNDHVTAMYGVNVTDAEKAAGVCRLNVLGRRDGSYDPRWCVHVAQCLPLGRAVVLSAS